MIVESTKVSICMRNEIFTKVPPKNGAISSAAFTVVRSNNDEIGGLISITEFSIVERDVAADPIIWFIASEIALRCRSVISPSVFVPSPPIIRSVMILTSRSFSTMMLEPSKPTVYLICVNTQGFSYSDNRLSHVASSTTGVVIFTLRLTSEYSVVAEDPMLILATSPIASRSTSDSVSFPLVLASAPAKNPVLEGMAP